MSDVGAVRMFRSLVAMRTLRKIYLIASIASAIVSLMRYRRGTPARKPRGTARRNHKAPARAAAR